MKLTTSDVAVVMETWQKYWVNTNQFLSQYGYLFDIWDLLIP
jgi:hypothetical protein